MSAYMQDLDFSFLGGKKNLHATSTCTYASVYGNLHKGVHEPL